MNDGREYAGRALVQQRPAGQPGAEVPLITLRLSAEEGRWLVTAIGIGLRLLEGLHLCEVGAQRYQIHGLAALHRIANQLPKGLSGYYPSNNDHEDKRMRTAVPIAHRRRTI